MADSPKSPERPELLLKGSKGGTPVDNAIKWLRQLGCTFPAGPLRAVLEGLVEPPRPPHLSGPVGRRPKHGKYARAAAAEEVVNG